MRVHFASVLSTFAIACIAITSAASSHAAIIDNFDTYPGASGGGWAGGWTSGEVTASQNHTIVDPPPELVSGGGHYLKVDTTRTSGNAIATTRRQYSTSPNNGSDVDVANQPYIISFDYRANTALGTAEASNSRFNRYNIIGSNSANTDTNPANTWIAGVWAGDGGSGNVVPVGFSNEDDANHWIFLDNTTGSNATMSAMSFWNSGFELDTSVVYHIEIYVKPDTFEYKPTISDGNASATPSGFLGFRNKTALTPPAFTSSYILFSTFMTAASPSLSYSVDNLTITVVPEPNALLLAGIGLAGAAVIGLRRRSALRK